MLLTSKRPQKFWSGEVKAYLTSALEDNLEQNQNINSNFLWTHLQAAWIKSCKTVLINQEWFNLLYLPIAACLRLSQFQTQEVTGSWLSFSEQNYTWRKISWFWELLANILCLQRHKSWIFGMHSYCAAHFLEQNLKLFCNGCNPLVPHSRLFSIDMFSLREVLKAQFLSSWSPQSLL